MQKPTVMFIKFVNQGAHSEVPQLDDTTVQTRQDPWSFGVERQTYKIEIHQTRGKQQS